MKRCFRIGILFVWINGAYLCLHAQTMLSKSVISSGGQVTADGSYILNLTIGQPAVAKYVTLNNITCVGFWYRMEEKSNKNLAIEKYSAPEPIKQNKPGVISDLTIYPNPFFRTAFIQFDLEATSEVRLSMIDSQGRTVDNIVDQIMQKGTYKIEYHSTSMVSGVHTICLKTNNKMQYKRCMILQ